MGKRKSGKENWNKNQENELTYQDSNIVIDVQDVSMHFKIANEESGSLKEYFIQNYTNIINEPDTTKKQCRHSRNAKSPYISSRIDMWCVEAFFLKLYFLLFYCCYWYQIQGNAR